MKMKRCYLLLLILLPLTLSAQYSVPLMEAKNGNQYLNTQVDGIDVEFTFDTGCSSVLINQEIFDEMRRRNLIKLSDLSEKGEAIIANGEAMNVRHFIIKELKIGTCVLHNVSASIGVDAKPSAMPLLGQSALERFNSYTIKENKLYFQTKPEQEQNALFIANKYRNDTTIANQQKVVEALTPYEGRLSFRYLGILADALNITGAYEQAIDIYERLLNSSSYKEDKQFLLHQKISAENSLADKLYEDAKYMESEQWLLRIIEQAKQDASFEDKLDYAYYSLFFVYMKQEEYTKAEECVQQYAKQVRVPNKHLAQVCYYLSRYFSNIEDYESAQRYKKLCDSSGGYKE